MWLWAAVAVGIIAAASVGVYALIRPEPPPAQTTAPVPIVVALAQLRDIAQSSRISGTLAPAATLNLTPKITGQITAVPASLGQRVKTGDVLLRLSTSDLEPQAKSAKAALTVARSALARMERGASWEDLEQVRAAVWQAQTAWDAAVKTYQRMAFLYGEGAISLQQLEGAEAQVKVATAQLATADLQFEKANQGADAETLAAARAQVQQAEAAYDAIAARLADAVLRAPRSGVVSYVRAVVGEMASPGITAIGLVDADLVYLEAGVTEGLIGRIRQGQEVIAEVPSTGGSYRGVIVGVAPAADSRTRLFVVRVEVPNPDGEIKPGMLGEVQILRDSASAVVAVPREALLGMSGAEHVYVVIDGFAQRREVRSGLADDTFVEILEGLEVGEITATTGASFLRDGVRVTVVREDTGR